MRLIAILFLLLCLNSCDQVAPLETAPQTIRPAKIMTVRSEGNEVTHQFTARIEALQSVDVSFEVGGPLTELPIREGETLSAGALVAALDPTDFQLAVREAEVQLRLAAQDLNRKRKVLAENGIAKSQVQDARSHYELQRVRLNKAKEQLEDSRIQAPFEAFVSRRYFDRHVNVQPGEPVARLLDLTKLQVVFNVPESLLATTDQERLTASWAEFSFSDGTQFDIAYLENRGEAEALAQTYEVSFTMPNPPEWNILPGMTATANIRLSGTQTGKILIPAASVIAAPDNSLSVWIYDPEDGQVSIRAIETGAPEEGGLPVTDGLAPGDQIIVTGASQLQPGMQVRPL